MFEKRHQMTKKLLKLLSITLICMILMPITAYSEGLNSFEQYNHYGSSSAVDSSSDSLDSDSTDTETSSKTQHKKVISVVYDNSWSTSGYKSQRWSYINYAFQYFVSMLDSNDDLFVTTTSKFAETGQVDLSGDRQNVIDNVRKQYFDTGGTEIQSLYTAYNKLENYQENDENTEFWLFVFTDGEFYHDSYLNTISADELKQMLNDCSEKVMSNGTRLNVACLTIGSDSKDLGTSDRDNVLFSHTSTDDGIIPSIIDVCKYISKVTNADDVSYLNWKQTGSNTIEVDAKHQVKNLYVLSQKTDAQITSIKCTNKENTNAFNQSVISYPSEVGYITNTELNGTLTTFNAGSSFFDSDTYIITFDKPISDKQISILFTPLLDIDIGLYVNGTDSEINPKAKYYETNQIYSTYRVYDIGTGQTVDLDKYFNTVSYSFKMLDGSDIKAQNNTDSMRLDNLPRVTNSVIFDASVKLDNAQPLNQKLSYSPNIYSGYQIIPKENNIKSILRTDLLNNKTPLYFEVVKNGKKLSRDVLLNTKFLISFNDQYKSMKSDIHICADGSISVTPYYFSNNKIISAIFNFLPTIGLSLGKMDVTCSISQNEIPNVSGTATVNVKREPFLVMILHLLELLIIVFLIIGFVFKERFCIKSKVYMSDDIKDTYDSYIFGRKGWKYKTLASKNGAGFIIPTGKSSFIPFIKNNVRLGDVIFSAKGFPWTNPKKRMVTVKTINNAIIVGKVLYADSITTASPVELSRVSRKLEVYGLKDYSITKQIAYDEGILVSDINNNLRIYKLKYYDEYVYDNEV